MPPFSRAIVIVLDGVGIGALPDADCYGDGGSNTLANVAARTSLNVPNLRSLGIDRFIPPGRPPIPALGATARMAEASPGKDSVTGHWELFGLVLDRAFPVFPEGFPQDAIDKLAAATGRSIVCNAPYSGTEVIEAFGEEHLRTRNLILYTSADSVCQIAAHEAVIPVAELYRICETAFAIFCNELGVGRVIARPFIGVPGAFTRTSRRRDFVLPPTGDTLFDRLAAHGHPVTAIGKIDDLFGGRGLAHVRHTASDDEGMTRVVEAMEAVAGGGLIAANLVDFDTTFGHRNDVDGFARNLERFDGRLGELLARLDRDDLLIVTADHGNDPTTPSTDHSREYVPLLAYGSRIRAGIDLGTRPTFADLGQTLAAMYGVPPLDHGTSFLQEMTIRDHP